MAKTKTSFSGHEKFECKIDWITKGLNAFSKNNQIFNLTKVEDGIETLGLGINMIKSLKHWVQVLGLIEQSELTELGHYILEKDPYLENGDTLWLLHWNIVKSQESATLYNLFFNTIYPYKFTREYILDKVTSWLKSNDINLSQTTIKSDIDVFIRMYKSSDTRDINLNLFSELKLITEQAHGDYVLNINAATDISDFAFIYILKDYIDIQNNSSSESISMDDIQRGKLSLQKSLCMGESVLHNKIHKLEHLTDGKLAYSEASGIRQIYINGSLDKADLLHRIYR
jgi:predicted XRE-type DNA-binding protein